MLFKKKRNLEKDIKEYNGLKRKPILFVKNLTKKYPFKPKPAINNISFSVYPGEFHAFIGANGAGKTTTIKSIIGAYANWNGTILINGAANTTIEAKKELGYIPEIARFPEKFSTYEYITWMSRLSGLSAKKAKEVANKKIKELKVNNLRNKSPNTFSSGQKKKILLAQALVHDPKIIVMDEPAANLDPKSRIEFFDELLALKKKKKAIFISSHILSELEKYADSATILDGGKIVFSGEMEDLFAMFKNHKWLLLTNNQDKVMKYLKQKKIDFEHDQVNNEIYINTSNKKKEIILLQKFLTSNKIEIERLEKLKLSLDEIYKKMVIKGSVDTMGE